MRQIDAANDDGSTAFIYACAFGHFGIASTLLAEGCDVDWRDDQGRTGAEIARAEGFGKEIAELLQIHQCEPLKAQIPVSVTATEQTLSGAEIKRMLATTVAQQEELTAATNRVQSLGLNAAMIDTKHLRTTSDSLGWP